MSSSLTTLSMSLRLSSSVMRTFHCRGSAWALGARRGRGAHVAAGRVADGVEDYWERVSGGMCFGRAGRRTILLDVYQRDHAGALQRLKLEARSVKLEARS